MKKTLPLLLAAILLLPLSCGKKDYSVKGDSVTVKLLSPEQGGPSKVRLQVLGDKLIRISATPDASFHDRSSLVIVPQKTRSSFTVASEDGKVKVSTTSVTASVDIKSGKLDFTDSEGKSLLSSGEGGKMTFSPIEVEGKKAYSTRVVFDSPEDEAFYGLGQQQTGEFNHKGLNEEL